MAEENKEEQLKDKIFKIFSDCRNEQVSDRRQVYFGQLWEAIYKWCVLIKAEDMGEEIYKVTKRITNKKSKANVPQEKEGFFKYLYKSLKTEKTGYYREYESGLIEIPKEKLSKLKKIDNILKMEEHNMGRKLTYDERFQCIHIWFKFDKQEYQKYIDLFNKKYVGSISFAGKNEDNEIDSLNSKEISPYSNPLDEYLSNANTEMICNAVKSVLEKKQERSRDCYKALFTLDCFNKYKNIEALYSVLDHEILDACQNNEEKPKQYEIYLKYHPKAQKNSANARASEILNEFKGDLSAYLKEKNPEIFS